MSTDPPAPFVSVTTTPSHEASPVQGQLWALHLVYLLLKLQLLMTPLQVIRLLAQALTRVVARPVKLVLARLLRPFTTIPTFPVRSGVTQADGPVRTVVPPGPPQPRMPFDVLLWTPDVKRTMRAKNGALLDRRHLFVPRGPMLPILMQIMWQKPLSAVVWATGLVRLAGLPVTGLLVRRYEATNNVDVVNKA